MNARASSDNNEGIAMSNQAQSGPDRLISWLKQKAQRLFGPSPQSPPPTARPPRRRVDWHEEIVTGVEPDWVIDFGTTATVAGVVDRLAEKVTPTFLVGSQEFPSDMVIENDKVVEVGANAFTYFVDHPETTFATSFKRYVDLVSRQSNPGGGDGLDQLIADFLAKALLGTEERLPGPASHIALSVPNSFNPTAVACIRSGVLKALKKLGARNLDAANVRVVRESEAVAYLHMRSDRLTNVPIGTDAGEKERLEWVTLQIGADDQIESVPGGSNADTRRPCVLVFDVGGGTTDLTVFNVEHRCVVLNAGVPLGGSDVDKIVLRALLKGGFRRTDKVWSQAVSKFRPLIHIRQTKDHNQSILSDLSIHRDDLEALCEKLSGLDIYELVNPIREPTLVANDFNKRIGQLVDLSVDGLFDLIPDAIWSQVDRVLLTGRGSQLERVRRAVLAKATARGVTVSTISRPYHLKLAVACGCALVRTDDFKGRRLPTTTLGRKLMLRPENQDQRLAIEFDAALPVPSDRPTLWSVRVPQGHYRLFEYRTCVTRVLLQELGVDAFRHLGLAREVLNFHVRGAGIQTQHFMWHPVSEGYFKVSAAPVAWTSVEPVAGAAESTRVNPLTGLSLGFPDVV